MTQTTAGRRPPERDTEALTSDRVLRVTAALSPAQHEQVGSRRPRMEVQ